MTADASVLAKSRVLLGLFSVLSFLIWSAYGQPDLTIDFNTTGLSSLHYHGVDYLAFGDFRLDQVRFQPSSGLAVAGDLAATTTVDAALRRVSRTSAWGSIVVDYTVAGNRLNVSAKVNNRSANSLRGIWFEPFGLRFPARVEEYNGNVPLITNSYGQPAVVRTSSEAGVVVLVSEDGARPVQIGFPYALDRPENKVFPLSLNTDRVASFPNSYPTIGRPIPPGGSDTFSFSLRFGPPGSTTATLAGDVYRKFAADFPYTLQWSDRRPIGALFLSTAAAGWPANPRGWLQDSKVDVTTASGLASLKTRILGYADGSVSILKKMNAQGMITWDIEGQQFPHAASYIGDPRIFETLAPEMSGIADEFFKRFRDAGLRVGVCIRPQRLELAADGSSVSQVPVADPTQLLIDKALYAKMRWGATLFYVDSNVNGDDLNPIDAGVFKRLAAALPEALFVPEHSRMRYYAHTAPIRELRQGHASTDADVRAVYPNAFSVIYTADGPIDARHDDLVAGVRHGDLLLFRGWFEDVQNGKDLAIYHEATQSAPSSPAEVPPKQP